MPLFEVFARDTGEVVDVFEADDLGPYWSAHCQSIGYGYRASDPDRNEGETARTLNMSEPMPRIVKTSDGVYNGAHHVDVLDWSDALIEEIARHSGAHAATVKQWLINGEIVYTTFHRYKLEQEK
jgi:hypothetical protein